MEKGWTAYDNGEKTEIKKFDDTFIAVPLDNREHFVELKFSVPFLKEGITISSVAILFLLADLYKRRQKDGDMSERKNSMG